MTALILLVLVIAFCVGSIYVFSKYAQTPSKRANFIPPKSNLSPEQEAEFKNNPELKKVLDDTFKELEISGRKRLRTISIKYSIFVTIAYLVLIFLFKVHLNMINTITFIVSALLGFIFVLGYALNRNRFFHKR